MEHLVETRLTLESLRTELDMNDQQRVNAMSVLPLLERLGLISWYDSAQCGLLIGTAENGPVNESRPLWIQDDGETENVVTMLRVICTLRNIDPDEDRFVTLEKRVTALEEIILHSRDNEGSAPLQNAAQDPGTHESKLEELRQRATAIGNTLTWWEDEDEIHYRRSRRKNPQGILWQTAFIQKDMLQTQLKRPHRQDVWFFFHDEMDVLEQVIIHDEALYAQLFTD